MPVTSTNYLLTLPDDIYMNKITNHQLYRLIMAHFLELIREPAILFWGILFPILMAWGLGLAFTKKADITRRAVVIRTEIAAQQPDSSKIYNFLHRNEQYANRQFTVTLKSEKLGNTHLLFIESTKDSAITLLKKGTALLIVEDCGTDVKYHFDPANAEAQAAFMQISSIVNHGINFYDSEQAEIKPITLTGMRYIDFLVPGLMAMGIMMSCTWGITYSLIERRSKKLLRRMVATPMKKSYFLMALMSARFTMNVAEAAILLLFGWMAFGITIQGSILAFGLIFITSNMAFTGISVLVSSHTSSTEVGNGIINAITTPMMVLSGVFFSYQNFPEWSQPVIKNLPLTMAVDTMRSIFNEGAGLAQTIVPAMILGITGIVCFTVGLKIFKWY
jgi:ABC-2 type transport system permease protein